MLEVRKICGKAIEEIIHPLGQLRMEIFRKFPYLYDGSLDYEKSYLRRYTSHPNACVFALFDREMLVGASTATLMRNESEEVFRPLESQGYDISEMMYLGESILRPEYRGKGFGKKFFHLRETYAKSFDHLRFCTFCAVDREANDPRRPAGYRDLIPFWDQMGYEALKVKTIMKWKEIDKEEESYQTLTFWIKEL
jgi:GNAT superfamily N-acetyltransferase